MLWNSRRHRQKTCQDRSWPIIAGILFLLASFAVLAANDDRFTYRDTDAGNSEYGPDSWNRVTCDNLDECQGWPDKWKVARGWDLKESGNQCVDCNNRNCGEHKQGPLNLRRETGLNSTSNSGYFECIDVHWMKYYDGACDWKDMTNNPNSKYRNNFFIREHALTVMEPIDETGRLRCPSGPGGHFPKLDYSKGFPDWWMLSHMDIKTPSEFVQDNTQYDLQINYAQFYEIEYGKQPKDGPLKKDGTVVIFGKAYSNVAPDPFLDKLICQFRRTEDAVRDECGLDSVSVHYPGCYNARRRGRGRRNLRYDPDDANNATNAQPQHLMPDTTKIVIDDEARGPMPTENQFDDFIKEQIEFGGGNGNWEGHPLLDPERHLLDYAHVPWHHFQLLINVRTEYYHRLEASQTVPPCQVHNHYRVMKDPLRIHPRQLAEVQRLLAERIAPRGSRHRQCRPYTAGKPTQGVNGGPAVKLNRPIQRFHPATKMQFCECKDWRSKWPEDKEWCKIGELRKDGYKVGDTKRYFDKPYNYDSGETLKRTGRYDHTNVFS